MNVEQLMESISIETVRARNRERREKLGKEDFLRLLITQLKYQDPLEPLKNEEFIAQLAQFNSLEQMINLNRSFSQMLTLQQLTQAAGLIGHSIEAVSEEGEEITGEVSEVQMVDGEPMLVVDGTLVKLNEVIRLYLSLIHI